MPLIILTTQPSPAPTFCLLATSSSLISHYIDIPSSLLPLLTPVSSLARYGRAKQVVNATRIAHACIWPTRWVAPTTNTSCRGIAEVSLQYRRLQASNGYRWFTLCAWYRKRPWRPSPKWWRTFVAGRRGRPWCTRNSHPWGSRTGLTSRRPCFRWRRSDSDLRLLVLSTFLVDPPLQFRIVVERTCLAQFCFNGFAGLGLLGLSGTGLFLRKPSSETPSLLLWLRRRTFF